jgi:hypothetical protein
MTNVILKEMKDLDINNFDSYLENIINKSEEEVKKMEEEINILRRERENMEEERLTEVFDNYNYLYPNLNDKKFNLKITNKQEFNDTRIIEKKHTLDEIKNKCNLPFELAPHQLFIRNFLSYQTPYKSILLYHGLGTGKTCSSITVSEEMREYLKQVGSNKKIIVVASPNVQDNFKLQLFDERNLIKENDIWIIKGSCSNSFLNEINPMKIKGLSKELIIKNINKIINKSYKFLGYTEFSNYIENLVTLDDKELNDKEKKMLKKQKIRSIRKVFSDRLIVIDEVHNIRDSEEKNKKVVLNLTKIVKYSDNLKLLLLSATPMFNSNKEIIWLLNLMNLNDKRSTIDYEEVFDENRNLKIVDGNEIGKELLIRKSRGYVSYVRGDNPYTFPHKIYPEDFNIKKSIKNELENPYPKKTLLNKSIENPIELLDLYIDKIGEYQDKGYNYILSEIKRKLEIEEESEKRLNYTSLEPLMQSLNFVYPNKDFDKDKNIEYRNLIGKEGLDENMKYNSTTKKGFEYKNKEYGRIFSPEEVGKYSNKLYSIYENIKNSDGVIMIYSQYIDGGCIPIALLLEEMGIKRYGVNNSLFKNAPIPAIDSITLKEKDKNNKNFKPAKYVMITGDKHISPNNLEEFKIASSDNNSNGELVKVIIISRAGGEGLDFKNVRQLHIMEPWYNLSRIEQTIGRAIRNCSHKNLPYEERNAEIFLYGTKMLENEIEAADLYIYRIAQDKAKKIGIISRLIKENSIDCLLREKEDKMIDTDFDTEIEQKLSNGNIIKFKVGDKAYSALCDYMRDCKYKCRPNIENNEDINMDTYNEEFIVTNSESIKNRIRDVMKDKYLLTKEQIISDIRALKTYPIKQVFYILNKMVTDKSEIIIDRYGRNGNLINIGEYYMFQPVELTNNKISYFERSVPLTYKENVLKIDLNKSTLKIKEDNLKDKSKEESKDKKYPNMNENILGNINKIVDYANKSITKTTNDKNKSNDELEWYYSVRLSKINLINILGENFEKNYNKFIIEHYLDILPFNKKLELFKKIININFNDNNENKINILVKEYFTEKIHKIKGENGIVFINEEEKPVIYVEENKKWKVGDPMDREIFVNILHPKEIPNIGEVIGFIGYLNKLIFKYKYTNRKSKGLRCDNSGKKNVKDFLDDIINNKKILNKNDIKERYKNGDEDVYFKIKKENTKVLPNLMLKYCSEIELLFRYLDYIKMNNKKWFLNYEEYILNNV